MPKNRLLCLTLFFLRGHLQTRLLKSTLTMKWKVLNEAKENGLMPGTDNSKKIISC